MPYLPSRFGKETEHFDTDSEAGYVTYITVDGDPVKLTYFYRIETDGILYEHWNDCGVPSNTCRTMISLEDDSGSGWRYYPESGGCLDCTQIYGAYHRHSVKCSEREHERFSEEPRRFF